MARKIRGGRVGDKMKLIMESWRAFLQEEESFDLEGLSDEERQLLQKILAAAKEKQLSEVGTGASRARSRKRAKKRRMAKIKAKRMKIASEYWKTHVEDVLSGAIQASDPTKAALKKAHELLGCQSQGNCILWSIPETGVEEALKDTIPNDWAAIDQHYENWKRENEDLWKGDLDGIKAMRTHTNARTTDVSEIPGLGGLKNSSLYKNLSKKLCPDSLSGGISLACLAKLSAQVADFFPGE